MLANEHTLQQPAKPGRNWLDTCWGFWQMWRPYMLMGPAAIALGGAAIAARDSLSLRAALISFLTPVFGYGAGTFLSDYLHRDLDTFDKPFRPIPRGAIKPAEAAGIGLALVALTFLGVALAGVVALLAGVVVGLVAYSYSVKLKNMGVWGNFGSGFIGVTTFLFGVVVVVSLSDHLTVQVAPLLITLFATGILLHDTAGNIVGTIRDVEGDKAGGIRTLPMQIGIRRSVYVAVAFSATYLALFSLPALLNWHGAHLSYLAYLGVAFLMQVRNWIDLLRRGDQVGKRAALRAHEWYTVERVVLGLALVAVIAPVIALALLLPTAGFTVITQMTMRHRYR